MLGVNQVDRVSRTFDTMKYVIANLSFLQTKSAEKLGTQCVGTFLALSMSVAFFPLKSQDAGDQRWVQTKSLHYLSTLKT